MQPLQLGDFVQRRLCLAQRDLLVAVTFGVVLLSILLQGLTIKPLLDRLAVVRRHDARRSYDVKRGEVRMWHAGIARERDLDLRLPRAFAT